MGRKPKSLDPGKKASDPRLDSLRQGCKSTKLREVSFPASGGYDLLHRSFGVFRGNHLSQQQASFKGPSNMILFHQLSAPRRCLLVPDHLMARSISLGDFLEKKKP